MIKALLKTLRSDQTQNESKQDRLYKYWQEDEISERFFKDRFDKLEKRQQEIKDRLEELEVEKEMWNENVGKIIDMIDSLKNFKEKFQEADDTTKQHMVKLMTNRIVARAYTGETKRVD